MNIYKLQRESKGCIFSSSSPRFLSCFFSLFFFFLEHFHLLFYFTTLYIALSYFNVQTIYGQKLGLSLLFFPSLYLQRHLRWLMFFFCFFFCFRKSSLRLLLSIEMMLSTLVSSRSFFPASMSPPFPCHHSLSGIYSDTIPCRTIIDRTLKILSITVDR